MSSIKTGYISNGPVSCHWTLKISKRLSDKYLKWVRWSCSFDTSIKFAKALIILGLNKFVSDFHLDSLGKLPDGIKISWFKSYKFFYYFKFDCLKNEKDVLNRKVNFFFFQLLNVSD